MTPITVVLTEYEMQMCAAVGRARHASAQERGRDPGRGPTGQTGKADGHMRGAQCEFACSIGLNLFWRPHIGLIREIDVGALVQVRSTVLLDGRMIVPARARDDDPYVLVRQVERTHTLLGWLDARTAKASAPLNSDHGDAGHYIVQRRLLNIHTLKRRLHHGLALDEIELEQTVRALPDPEDDYADRAEWKARR